MSMFNMGIEQKTAEQKMKILINILQEKKTLLEEICLFTEKQADVITEDGLDDLKKLIDEKQQRIDKLKELDIDFVEALDDLKKNVGIESLEEPAAANIPWAGILRQKTVELVNLIEKISLIEKANNKKANDLLKSFGDQIKRINCGKKVSFAYVPKPYSQPSYFIDKKR